MEQDWGDYQVRAGVNLRINSMHSVPFFWWNTRNAMKHSDYQIFADFNIGEYLNFNG